MKRNLFRGSVVSLAFVAMAAFGPAAALADSSASDLPPEWHIHDNQSGGQHKPAGFFPTVLEISLADYLLDPAACPNATDKAFLPSAGSAQSPLLRAGVCMTDAYVIQLRTVPIGVSGPDGWDYISGTDGGTYITYYRVTPR
jgi:hypothetical protein